MLFIGLEVFRALAEANAKVHVQALPLFYLEHIGKFLPCSVFHPDNFLLLLFLLLLTLYIS